MATSMAAQHPATSVSLHPLASRDGQCSSTIVSVQVPQEQGEISQAGSRQYASDPRLLQEIQAKLDAQSQANELPQATTPRLTAADGVNAGDLEAASYASLVGDGNHEADFMDIVPSYSQQSSGQTWGLQYDDIEQYPIIDDQPALCTCIEQDGLPQIFASDDAPPIRAMTAAQFAKVHAQYNALDVPHSVVFPFLHGVDGDNVAQNTFFRAPLSGQPAPNYRGLTVVRADLPTPAQQAQMMKQHQQEQRRRKSASGSAKDNRFAMSGVESSNGHSMTGFGAASSSGHCHEDKSVDPTSPSSSSSGGNASRRSSGEEGEGHTDNGPSTQTSTNNGSSGLASFGLGTFASNASFTSSLGSSDQSGGHSFFSDNYDDDDDDDESRSESQTSFATSLASESMHDNGKGHRRTMSNSYNPQPDKCILNSSLYPYEVVVPPLMLNRKTNKTFHVSPAAMPAALQQSDCVMVETASFFTPPQNPGVNLRNFKIQSAKYATISDIVIYCPFGIHEGAVTLAKWFREAQETCWENRLERKLGGLRYNVFVVTEAFDAFEQFPHLIAIDRHGVPHDRVDFVDREREEMQRLTTATAIDDNVWLGCSADVPLIRGDDDCGSLSSLSMSDDDSTRKANPNGFSICIECHDAADVPDSNKLQHASQFLDAYDSVMEDSNRHILRALQSTDMDESSLNGLNSSGSHGTCGHKASILAPELPPRSEGKGFDGDGPSDLVHLECSSVSGLTEEAQFAKAASDILNLCAWIKAQAQPPKAALTTSTVNAAPSSVSSSHGGILAGAFRSVQYGRHHNGPSPHLAPVNGSRGRSTSASAGPQQAAVPSKRLPHRVLLHCGDGYTETSILALAYLMYARGLSLPEAYLDLQERAKRSFFVYARDVAFLKKLEQYIVAARPKEPERPESPTESSHRARSKHSFPWLGSEERDQRRRNGSSSPVARKDSVPAGTTEVNAEQSVWQRGIAGLVSAAGARKTNPSGAPTSSAPSNVDLMGPPSRALTPTPASVRAAQTAAAATKEATASHAWFTNPRFEGAFPSRILPFLYLGNLNHALNPAMLHALGITHVVSVGESALHPPAASAAAVADSSGPGGQTTLPRLPESEALNALWHEQQAGRISVLDLKNVSDDGIDPLRSTMRVAVEYIESARRSGGKVLVHCRVGVSRSTTIVLAYVMAHLDMTLVESYLLVRSRRLSILIQPHLLFFWELRGWETFVASQKAKRQQALREHPAMTSDGQVAAIDCSLEAKKRAQPTLPPRQLTNKPVGASCGFAASQQQDDAFDLDVDIGQGAGSPYGFGVANVADRAFGSGSPSGIKADALRLNWGFLCREIAALNERYF